ncbi:MAG TPA: hypothetical protein VFC78_11935 [Tepidisphaeraceae bacterium]|nr:hypothetical protein [Tepidisphaeraceae bacterium]
MRQVRVSAPKWRGVMLVGCAIAMAGCQSHPTTFGKPPASTGPIATGLMAPRPLQSVDAWCDPPVGWKPDPLRIDAQHAHEVWASPSRQTAYGVVLIHLPLPFIGPNLIIPGFLNHLRAKDHKAELISKEDAPDLPGARFVAESGKFHINVNLIVHGWSAWAVYTGTLLTKPVNAAELKLAREAVDNTRVSLPDEVARTARKSAASEN